MQTPAPRAGRREWISLAVIALPCTLYSMDLTVLNLAVPSLARDMTPTASELLWIIDIYGFMVAGFLMVMGALGDRLGRRRILLIGAAAFGVMSVVAAFAQTPTQLIIARAALGIAGATLAPSTLSLITSMFRDERQRTFAISIWITSFSVGAIIGPVVGGVLIEWFWWGAVFLAGVPVMLLLLVLGPFLLPEYKDPSPGRIDLASAALSLVAVLSLIWGIKHGAEYGLDLKAAAALALGTVLVTLFIRRQGQLANPLIDLSLFRIPRFSLSVGINLIAIFFMFGSFIFFAQYLQLVLGLSPLLAGLWSLPGAVAFAMVSPLTATLAAQLGAVRLMAGGLLVSAIGFTLMAITVSLEGMVAANVILSVGFTPVMALTTGFIVGAAPVEKAGVASAISETAAEFGGALGIAVLGSLLTLIYRTRMATAELPGLRGDLERTARSTLAGAAEASTALPAESGAMLLTLGRSAFTDAFHLIAALAAAALIGLTVVTVRVLSGANPAQAAH